LAIIYSIQKLKLASSSVIGYFRRFQTVRWVAERTADS